ncbi:MAG: hypothetical protein ABEI77_05495 [Halorientalis sp.]
MTEKTVVDLVEEWQTGAGLLLVSAVVGFLVGAVLVPSTGSALVFLVGFFAGAILTFLTLSYLLYGR